MPFDNRKNKSVYARPNRLPAVDAMRGLVIVLMAVDHASFAFNSGRYVTDSVAWYHSGSVIPGVQFLLRWMTHLCAPTFVFLAGLAMAYSIARRQSGGLTQWRIDADLLIRGLFLMALDPLWMSFGFGGGTVFQVLYAIGGGVCSMVLLRRMGMRMLLPLGLLLLVGSEVLAGLALRLGDGQNAGPIGALFVVPGRLGNFAYVLYPLLPWLPYMVLGLCCGRLLNRGTIRQPVLCFAVAGLTLLVGFVVVRGLNGFGNMLLYRDSLSLLQWLHVSKYPPSLTFALLTLGMMCLGLALFFKMGVNGSMLAGHPLLVFGRAPLFFYLFHVHLLSGSAWLLGVCKKGGLLETFAAAGVVLLILYPLCRRYASFKRSHPRSLLRFI